MSVRRSSGVQMVTRMNPFFRTAHAIALAVPLLASAQAPAAHPAADAGVPGELRFESAFDDYRAYEDPPVRNWRTANDTVGAAAQGGAHASHHATSDAPSSAQPGSPTPAPGQPKHQERGHHMHGGHQ